MQEKSLVSAPLRPLLPQTRHNFSQASLLPIINEYPGTNSVDGQGATPGIGRIAGSSMDWELEPFIFSESGHPSHRARRVQHRVRAQGDMDRKPFR